MDIFRNARQNFLRRQAEAEQADLERQQAREAFTQQQQPEMQEMGAPQRQQRPQDDQQAVQPQARSSPVSAVLRRFADLPRPSMPSFVSRQMDARPRPTSSRYDDDDVAGSVASSGRRRGRGHDREHDEEEIISPKTPQFELGMPPLPSTRLHLPNLQRTWTQGSNGPPSRPGTSRSHFRVPFGMGGSGARPGRRSPSQTRTRDRSQSRTRPMAAVAQPVPVVPAQHIYTRLRRNTDDTDNTNSSSHSSSGRSRRSHRRQFDGADPAEMHLADMANDGRRRRRRRHGGSGSGSNSGSGSRSDRHSQRRRRQYAETTETTTGDQTATTATTTAAASSSHRKRFLFCFPYIRSRRIRAQILRCFVSGAFLALMLGVYLALMMTHNITNSEFSVLLILIMLITTIFFSHSLIRLCVLIVHPPTPEEEAAAESRYRSQRSRGGAFGMLPNVYGPGGYAIPQRPIRVVLARDEEAAGLESVTAKTQPPAYGLWRESVRVDPNRIYWQRNDEAAAIPEEETSQTAGAASSNSPGSAGNARSSSDSSDADASRTAGGRYSPRPPSYASDDGVRYVVEAQPRSIAPTTEIPLPQHPAEAGRIGRPAEW